MRGSDRSKASLQTALKAVNDNMFTFCCVSIQ